MNLESGFKLYIFVCECIFFLFMVVVTILKLNFELKNFFMSLTDYKILFDGRCCLSKNLNSRK